MGSCVGARRQRKQQIDEPFRCGAGFVIGQARTFIGFNEGVVRLIGRTHHQVDPRHRDVDGPRRRHGGFNENRMHLIRDVMDGAAQMQVGRLADKDLLALSCDIIQAITGLRQRALRFGVNGDAGFAARPVPAITAISSSVSPSALAARLRASSSRSPAFSCRIKPPPHDRFCRITTLA